MTVRDYIEPTKLLFDLVTTYDNANDLIQSNDFQQRLLPILRQIQKAGQKDQFIEFVYLLLAD